MKDQVLDTANLFFLSDFVSMMEHLRAEDLYTDGGKYLPVTGNESEMQTRYLVATLAF